MSEKLKVMVLAGGPDRERPVSLQSGSTVADALKRAGHDVLLSDVLPADLGALDEFVDWRGDVMFPMLHGSWGEGGSLQAILDERGIRYVGCTRAAAELCMDKHHTKVVLAQHNLPTPEFEVLMPGETRKLAAPVVIKAPREGSSIDLMICRTADQADNARVQLASRHTRLLVEKFIKGKELTVGIIGDDTAPDGYVALPPIHIVPATEYYDYEAKYTREDTQYRFDIDLPGEVIAEVKRIALATHRVLGCRHLSRVDFIVDEQHQPWVLEVNTIPGFTSHSLLPKAAAHAGIALPKLVDRLVRLAMAG